ncbi:hypothetical protein LCGC14_0434870 [marine sediment metagenome]|uniref:Uncharacterized protein n=1 Tax=marine sediment metagenome TaxID=412755 RepID=A0A0F9SM04_9ZZZZ
MVSIEQLRQEIQVMTRRTLLYKALKEELSTLGYWRNRARGKNIADVMANKEC